jgi:hypothetical protein
LVPKLCFRCTNLSRRQPTVDLLFLGGWADWALKNQRELAQDEPLNWVMQIATHNSYNTFADGHSLFDFPNQIYSTTDQLRAGARVITFDNYYILGPTTTSTGARLCHSAYNGTKPNLLITAELCAVQLGNTFYPLHPPSLRYYSNGIKEIRNWLDQNPNEIVIVDFEEYVPQMGGPDEAVLAPIRAYLGDMVLTPPPPVPPASVTGSITGNVLTVTAVGSGTLHVDDQITGTGIPDGTVIQSFGTGTGGTGTYNLNKTSVTGSITNGVLTVTALGSGVLYAGDQITGASIPDGTFIVRRTGDTSGSTGPFGTGDYDLSQASLTGVPSETITTTLTVPSETITKNTAPFSGRFPDRWPTRREMLAAGKRVIILDNAYSHFSFAQKQPDGTYLPSEFLFSEHETVAGTYSDGTWLAKNQRRYDPKNPTACFEDPRQGLTDFDVDFHKALFTKATIIVEERELGEFVGFSVPLIPQAEFGLMSDKDIVDATECNYSIITLDKYSQVLIPPDGAADGSLDYLIYTLLPDFHRQDLAVWSWKPFDRGQNGDCAMLEGSSSRRWASANCSSQAKFACAKPRSQSGKDPLQWQDPLGDDWRVTSATGSWDAGPSTCQAEFGSDFVFSVPVNGYQNRKLKDADTATDNIWLNYSQRNGDDKWVTGGGGSSRPPVAKAGPNQVAECGTSVNLDADGSYSRDGGGILSYKWQGPFGIRTTQIVNLATPRDLPLGVDPILLAVTDSHGQTATDSLTVTVQDTTPPSLTVSLSTGSARRHSHFVPVRATITARDSCDSEPPSIALLSIELVRGKDHEKDHEKDHDKSDIDTYVRGATFGTDDREFELARGEEHDRTYIVTYSATDLSGNVTKISAQVVVEEAHDD